MNVLIIGSGGREHAICRTFSKSSKVDRLYCADGNAGIAQSAVCVPIRPDDIDALTKFALANEIDLTFVGGETPLALGIVDEFESHGLKIIGPNRAAAQLEASKSFAKDFMARNRIPTARYLTANSVGAAVNALERGEFGDKNSPVVVKADGLAAGKGVVVTKNRTDAIAAIDDMSALAGSASEKIVLEECLIGKEVSLLMFAGGEDFALMPPTRDHKRIGEGDTGPNTGGMGAVTSTSILTDEQLREIEDTIIRPTLRGCVNEGMSFRGILFLGLMMVAAPAGDRGLRPMLLEYNVRFGDPETQAILIRLETDFVDICEALLSRESGDITCENADDGLGNPRSSAVSLSDLNIKWSHESSACVVLAAKNYPRKPQTGDRINGVENAASIKGVEIFHAATERTEDGDFTTAGGRVLGVTAVAANLTDALSAAYRAVDKISFSGMQYRRDIGL